MVIGVPSQVQIFPDSVYLNDERFIIDDAPVFEDFVRKCTVSLKDDVIPCCPKCLAKKIVTRHVKRSTTKTFERWDIINRMPTKVFLNVRIWQCKKCGHPFVDPRSPYKGRDKTTEAFEIYIAETLLSSTHLTQQDLADRFKLRRPAVSKMLTNYIGERKHKLPPAVPCETLWLLPFKYNRKKHLLILGRPDSQLGHFYGSRLRYRTAFLGISDKYSFASAIECSNILEPEKVKFFYCPKSLLPAARSAAAAKKIKPFRIFKLFKHDQHVWMGEKLLDILKDFEKREFSLKQAAYVLRYSHAYRTPILSVPTWQHPNGAFPLIDDPRSFPYMSLMGKSCYYVDTETLIHIYGKQ